MQRLMNQLQMFLNAHASLPLGSPGGGRAQTAPPASNRVQAGGDEVAVLPLPRNCGENNCNHGRSPTSTGGVRKTLPLRSRNDRAPTCNTLECDGSIRGGPQRQSVNTWGSILPWHVELDWSQSARVGRRRTSRSGLEPSPVLPGEAGWGRELCLRGPKPVVPPGRQHPRRPQPDSQNRHS